MDFHAAIFLFIVFFVLAFITDALPFFRSVRRISSFSRDSIRTFNEPGLSDDEKQAAMLRNSFGIFRESLRIIFFMVVLLAILYFALKFSYIIKPLSYERLTADLLSVGGIALSIGAFLSYFLVRKLL